jgi:ribosomal protein L37AE/L43A
MNYPKESRGTRWAASNRKKANKLTAAQRRNLMRQACTRYLGKVVTMAIYRCKHCGIRTARDSRKAWINSYCKKTGKLARLIRVT